MPAYITGQAVGAILNGSRVRKKVYRPGDTHNVGDEAEVLSSTAIPEGIFEEAGLEVLPGDEFFYFVEWDDLPGFSVGIRGSAIEEAS